MTEVWFTADLHFHHRNILYHHPDRPGGGLLPLGMEKDILTDVMNGDLVANWNGHISNRDEVWVLGDFSFGTPVQKARIFNRLNGSKHLIAGNHDNNATKRLGWASVHDLHAWRLKPHRAVMCHYPLLTWNGAHSGAWMLHGHSHGLLRAPTTTRMDVGVDCHPAHRPFHLDEIITIMAGRTYDVEDGHGAES